MRRSEFKPLTALAGVGIAVAFGAAACGQRDALIAFDNRERGSFESSNEPDAAPSSADVPMCPVTTCRLPRATCPSSQFPCDVDLMTDNENCGGCGVRCGNGTPTGWWTCVRGQCAFACSDLVLDCDGDPTNGCEVSWQSDSNNCGDCGVQCPAGYSCDKGSCVNGCQVAGAPDICNGICTNLNVDAANCGTCGHTCDPTGPNLPALPTDMFYGCGFGYCGNPACSVPNAADCNDDLSDGCEATLHTAEHCGACNDACKPGKECRATNDGSWACLCEDDNETLCSSSCVRLDDDATSCGGCFRACPGLYLPHYAATCSHGVCNGQCADGYANCDGINVEGINGCEVDTRVDNRHCGACGHACLPDQVCSEGQCLVTPCDAGTEDPTR